MEWLESCQQRLDSSELGDDAAAEQLVIYYHFHSSAPSTLIQLLFTQV